MESGTNDGWGAGDCRGGVGAASAAGVRHILRKCGMKNITTLALAAAFTAAASVPAHAVDIKMDGEWLYQFQTASEGFTGQNTEYAGQRVRLGLSMTASEKLSAYAQFQVAEDNWGTAGKDGEQAENPIFARQLYLDWVIPGTDAKVRMGRHAFDMPAYVFCSPVITDYVAEGVVLDLPLADSFGLTGFWTRAASDADSSDVNGKDFDLFGIVAKVSSGSFETTPWAIYGSKKAGAGGDYEEQSTLAGIEAAGDMLLLGAGMEWKAFDPFTLSLDAAWGKVNYGAGEEQDDSGWYVAAGASYALDFAEPALKVWYASGDDKGERAQAGHLPSVFGDSDASNMFFNGAPGIVGGHRTSIGGTWGVSAQLNGLSFLQNLTHDLSVTYIGGTNHKDNAGYDIEEGAGFGYDYMTTGDSAIEFAAVNTYEIYKNLSAIVEAAYILEDFDTSAPGRAGADFEDDWRLSLTFAYTF